MRDDDSVLEDTGGNANPVLLLTATPEMFGMETTFQPEYYEEQTSKEET